MIMSEPENIDLSASEGVMNEDEQVIFQNIRSKSNDSLFGNLLMPNINDIPGRSLVIEPPAATTPETAAHLRLFRKNKKEKVKSKCDYEKNICGYITKKVIRQFVGRNYEERVQELCGKYRSTVADCRQFYLGKVELITGPSHMPDLFPKQSENESSLRCKLVFREFYRWFLKERYLRYLLLEGKMTNKQAYIEYKNHHLFQYAKESEVPMRMVTRSHSHNLKEESE